ncbi:MAG: DUF1080 domain-containing protein [Bacteroidaceae bacterium]|nr:DUF1080 domain-containing protein [Bacteroidaceae bacterium]
MKKTILMAAAIALLSACCGKSQCGKTEVKTVDEAKARITELKEEIKQLEAFVEENVGTMEAEIVNNEQYDLTKLKQDAEGYYILFDGTSLDGWRGYGMDAVPTSWENDGESIHLKGSGTGEAQAEGGGDLLFAHKFANFTLELEYKISKGGNSGIFYLAQEAKNADGEYLPIWQSCSEYQVLDNENHVDAKLGVDGNRQSASLYDMVPAKPQNAKPFGEWNKVKIEVFKGTVIHYQNDEKVCEYHLWTQKWIEMLDGSKFCKTGEFPYAYGMMSKKFEDGGYIALQDHGDDVWYRNVRLKVVE